MDLLKIFACNGQPDKHAKYNIVLENEILARLFQLIRIKNFFNIFEIRNKIIRAYVCAEFLIRPMNNESSFGCQVKVAFISALENRFY